MASLKKKNKKYKKKIEKALIKPKVKYFKN